MCVSFSFSSCIIMSLPIISYIGGTRSLSNLLVKKKYGNVINSAQKLSEMAPINCIPSNLKEPEYISPVSFRKKPTAITPHNPQNPCIWVAEQGSSIFK